MKPHRFQYGQGDINKKKEYVIKQTNNQEEQNNPPETTQEQPTLNESPSTETPPQPTNTTV